MERHRLHRNTRIALGAVILFLLFDFAALALNIWLSSKIERQAVAINLAGRQRMLSQRMTKALLQIDHAQFHGHDPGPHLAELQLTTALFDSTLRGFAEGHETMGGDNKPVLLQPVQKLPLRRLVADAEAIWKPYRNHINRLLESPREGIGETLPTALDYAIRHNLDLLSLMNALTTELEAQTQREAAQIRWFQGAAFLLALINFFGAFGLYLHRLQIMSRSHGLLDTIIDKVQACVLVVGGDQRVIKANGMAEALFGYAPGGLPGRRQKELLREEHGELAGIRADGSRFLAHCEQNEVIMDDATVSILTVADITQRREAEAQLNTLAYHDHLTLLPNRLLFDDRLRHAIAQALRDKSVLAVLFIDLDNFKPINDTYGHKFGDLLLQSVAGRLCSFLRETDTVSRRGGDEFTVILPNIDGRENAVRIAEKILEQMSSPFVIEGSTLHIGASIGISLYPQDGTDAETLIARADEAMYEAKRAGRNVWRCYAHH